MVVEELVKINSQYIVINLEALQGVFCQFTSFIKKFPPASIYKTAGSYIITGDGKRVDYFNAAAALCDKLERLYPCHFLATESYHGGENAGKNSQRSTPAGKAKIISARDARRAARKSKANSRGNIYDPRYRHTTR